MNDLPEMARVASGVPDGWQKRRLGEVCRLWNGRAYKKEELLERGKHLVLRVGNFFTNDRWYYSDLELEDEKYCDDGDLLYAWSASFGPRLWAGGKVIYHYHIWKITVDDRLIDKDFLFHFLDWDAEQIKSSIGSGSTMIHVTKGAMEQRAISLPPLDEQRRIAEVLRSVDDAIAAAEVVASQAAETFAALLAELFSRYGAASAKLESYCLKGGLQTGPFGSQLKAEDYVEEGIPIIMPVDLTPDGMDFEGAKKAPTGKSYELARHILQPGDVLFARRGEIGRCGLYLDSDPIALCGTGCLRARLDANKIDPVLAYFLIQSRQARDWLCAHAVGATMPNLNTAIIGDLPMPDIPLPEQAAWVDAMMMLERTQRINQRVIVTHQMTKAALMSDLLSGHVRVLA